MTGHQAWQSADDTAGTFTVSPLRTGTTGNPTERPAAQPLAAATLRRVADEAARVAGEPVDDIRLVVPAGWGPRRRTWLRGAAEKAGLRQPELVIGPVAVANLLPVMDVPVPDEAILLIIDIGSGSEATVLRRTATGFDVLSTLADPQAGGDAIDELLLTHTSQPTAPADIPSTDPAVPVRDMAAPAGPGERRWALLASVRAGKESLAHRATAAIGPPPPAPVTIITPATVQNLARPVLHRTATLAEKAIAAADITTDDLYGIYCIGAAATTPGLSEAITEQLDIIPAILTDPATIAALSAAANPNHHAKGTPASKGGTATEALTRVTTMMLPAAASLALLTQFLLTTTTPRSSSSTVSAVNWGELTLAAVFAVLTCLNARPHLAALLRLISQAQTHPPQTQTPPGSPLLYGTIAGATVGLCITGLYAIIAALYTRAPFGSALRWTVVPAVCVAIIAASVTAITAYRQPHPQGAIADKDARLRFPPGATILTTAGMLLIQYTLTTPRPPDLATYIDLGTRLGGLLIGIGATFNLVKALLLRLILALPLGLLTAAIVSTASTGILAALFTLTVILWCSYPLLNLLITTPPPQTNRAPTNQTTA
ncbi:MAG: Hsp70 family protein [Actinoplanes sp.]